ncbi:hypothetical protein P5V15_005909 [Pogonomyrmex californicus]
MQTSQTYSLINPETIEITDLANENTKSRENNEEEEEKEEGKEENEEENNEKNEEDDLRKTKPVIVENQALKSNIIDSRELLFLRKDNIVYFVDINGKPLDSGSQKLFERNELPKLRDLILGKTRAIKYRNYYHLVLTISEGQREGPTMTLILGVQKSSELFL